MHELNVRKHRADDSALYSNANKSVIFPRNSKTIKRQPKFKNNY